MNNKYCNKHRLDATLKPLVDTTFVENIVGKVTFYEQRRARARRSINRVQKQKQIKMKKIPSLYIFKPLTSCSDDNDINRNNKNKK